VVLQLTGTDETGPSRRREKGATASVWREKAIALEEAGGRWIRWRVARTQPQPEPQGDHVAEPQPDPAHVAEPQPDPAPA
ncbi:hypothetical protein A2U01_0094887, partial [Trifolium medium]|nr:hypothetical protein [Trifolium medium]